MKSRSTTKTVVLSIGLVILAVLLLWVVAGVVAVTLFHFTDPADAAFPVTIQNDLSYTVTLEQCGDTCTDKHAIIHLSPGGSTHTVAVDNNIANPWIVLGPNGNQLGCVLLKFRTRSPGAVVKTSETSPCPA